MTEDYHFLSIVFLLVSKATRAPGGIGDRIGNVLAMLLVLQASIGYGLTIRKRFTGSIEGKGRANYIRKYLKSVHAAITKDNCNVYGYSYWSLMDNFEWRRGFTECFGLYKVDFDSPNKTRTPRMSSEYYSTVSRTKCL